MRGCTPDRTSHNHTYFSEIQDEVGAYLLGLLAADGCVRVKGPREREIRLKLRSKDRSLVELARDVLAPKATVHEYGDDALLQFNSTRMAADLARLGVIPGKTYSLTWPEHLASKWHRGFLLGYFDGNGYAAHVQRSNSGASKAQWVLSGRDEFLVRAADVIEASCGVRPGDPYRYTLHGARLKAVCNRALAVDQWLHDGTHVGLARKRLQ